jgi:polyisoprenoid-binding protein YceI
MKKIAIILGLIGVTVFSCTEKKIEEVVEKPAIETQISQEEPSDMIDGIVKVATVKWTGFKTTEKIAVSGTFDAVQVLDAKEGNTPQEILQGAKVRVPVTSIDSGLEERDTKLKMILFGSMLNTSDIFGVLNFKDGKTYIKFTLNDVSKEYEVQSNFQNNIFTIKTTINLDDFKANAAVEALNKACFDLHTGADGVSKTWSEVDIEGTVEFAKELGK